MERNDSGTCDIGALVNLGRTGFFRRHRDKPSWKSIVLKAGIESHVDPVFFYVACMGALSPLDSRKVVRVEALVLPILYSFIQVASSCRHAYHSK